MNRSLVCLLVCLALLLGALMIHGVTPGPLIMKQHPEIFWGVVVSMYVGNMMLLVLNLPLIGLWVKVLRVPPRILFPFIFLFCFIGSYSVNDRVFDMIIMLLFGMIGYFFRKFEYPVAPLILAFILEPMFEIALRQSLIMSRGSYLIFLSRPVATVTLIVALLLLISSFLPQFRKRSKLLMKDK